MHSLSHHIGPKTELRLNEIRPPSLIGAANRLPSLHLRRSAYVGARGARDHPCFTLPFLDTNNNPTAASLIQPPILLSVYLSSPPLELPIHHSPFTSRSSANYIHTLSSRIRTHSPGPASPFHPQIADTPSIFFLMIRSITAFAESRRQSRSTQHCQSKGEGGEACGTNEELGDIPLPISIRVDFRSCNKPRGVNQTIPATAECDIRWTKTYRDISKVHITVPSWVTRAVLVEYCVKMASKTCVVDKGHQTSFFLFLPSLICTMCVQDDCSILRTSGRHWKCEPVPACPSDTCTGQDRAANGFHLPFPQLVESDLLTARIPRPIVLQNGKEVPKTGRAASGREASDK